MRQVVDDLGHVDERVAAVEVGEQLLVVRLEAVVELLDRGAPAAPARAAPGRGPGSSMPMAPNSRPALSRSDRMASPTPGYCTLTATARPSWVMARWTCPIDADAIGFGSHSAKTPLGRRAQLLGDDLGRQLGAHRRGVRLQLGQGLAHVLGQALVEVAGHLAELHHGALHVAEGLGDGLRRLQLELGVELALALGRGERPAGPVQGVGPARLGADARHRGAAGGPRSSSRSGPVGAAAAAARLRASCTASTPAGGGHEHAEDLGGGASTGAGHRASVGRGTGSGDQP